MPSQPGTPAAPDLSEGGVVGESFATVSAVLDRAQVLWALLRGGAGSRDIDVLVAIGDLPRAVAALESHGLLRVGGHRVFTDAFLVEKEAPAGRWAQFDLATELNFGPRADLRTTAALACLSRRRREAGIWVLAPEDEFWALLLHCVLDKGTFPDRHRRRLIQLASEATLDSPLVRGIPAAVPCAELLEHARAGRWQALVAVGPTVRRSWRAADRAILLRMAMGARAMATRIALAPLSIWRNRGVCVAVLGPDDAGKSVLAAGIESTFYFPVRRIRMDFSRHGDPSRHRLVGSAVRRARRPLAAWWHCLAGVWHRAVGRLVVFEWHPYDALLPPDGPIGCLKRPYLRALARACPAPDIVILLDAPGGLMHQPCGDRPANELEVEHVHFARIAARIPHLVRIRAERPLQAVLDDALDHIWRHYRQRTNR